MLLSRPFVSRQPPASPSLGKQRGTVILNPDLVIETYRDFEGPASEAAS
jgi:hypothetical protein